MFDPHWADAEVRRLAAWCLQERQEERLLHRRRNMHGRHKNANFEEAVHDGTQWSGSSKSSIAVLHNRLLLSAPVRDAPQGL